MQDEYEGWDLESWSPFARTTRVPKFLCTTERVRMPMNSLRTTHHHPPLLQINSLRAGVLDGNPCTEVAITYNP